MLIIIIFFYKQAVSFVMSACAEQAERLNHFNPAVDSYEFEDLLKGGETAFMVKSKAFEDKLLFV